MSEDASNDADLTQRMRERAQARKNRRAARQQTATAEHEPTVQPVEVDASQLMSLSLSGKPVAPVEPEKVKEAPPAAPPPPPPPQVELVEPQIMVPMVGATATGVQISGHTKKVRNADGSRRVMRTSIVGVATANDVRYTTNGVAYPTVQPLPDNRCIVCRQGISSFVKAVLQVSCYILSTGLWDLVRSWRF